MDWITRISDVGTGIVLHLFILCLGFYFTKFLGGFYLLRPSKTLRLALSGEGRGTVSPLRALSVSLAGTLGVGNIVGVAVALIIGGAYMVYRKVISARIPVAYLGTVTVVMLIAGKFDLEFLAYQLMGGGLLLGAFFMATDYSTSPIKSNAKIVFGIGCGLITCIIRLFGSLPEGVSFAILIMNLLVPHIETIMAPKPFGTVKEKKSKAKEGEAK